MSAKQSYLGPFELIERLGGGGQGQVWRGRRIGSAVDRAIKVIRLDHGSEGNAEIRHRVGREIAILQKIDHPHIVKAYGFEEVPSEKDPTSDGSLLIEYEFVRGVTVSTMLEQGGQSSTDAVKFVVAVAEGLGEVHHLNALHRDVKPSNIMLRDRDWSQPVVIDFLCVAVDGATTLTSTANAIGTVDYMAPEVQIATASASAASDQWSLAVVATNVVTATLTSSMTSSQVQIEGSESLLGRIRPHLSEVLAKAGDRKPERRYPTIRAFAEAFVDAAILDGWVFRHTVHDRSLDLRLLDAPTRSFGELESARRALITLRGRILKETGRQPSPSGLLRKHMINSFLRQWPGSVEDAMESPLGWELELVDERERGYLQSVIDVLKQAEQS